MTKTDQYFENLKSWKAESELLREICNSCFLEENLKWNHPCYMLEGKNIALIHGFKSYCALLFHNGALLKDELNILVQQTKNVQAARQLRFTSTNQIVELKPIIRAYLFEAIENERKGLKIQYKSTADFPIPIELKRAFNESNQLKTAFYKLSPGRQRGYLLYFESAKKSETKITRIQNSWKKIIEGKGYNER